MIKCGPRHSSQQAPYRSRHCTITAPHLCPCTRKCHARRWQRPHKSSQLEAIFEKARVVRRGAAAQAGQAGGQVGCKQASGSNEPNLDERPKTWMGHGPPTTAQKQHGLPACSAPYGARLPAVAATLAASCGCCRQGLPAENKAAGRPACSPEAGQEHLDARRPGGCQLRHLDAADWRRQAAPLCAPPLAAAQQPPQAGTAPPRWLAVAQLHHSSGAAGARSAGA